MILFVARARRGRGPWYHVAMTADDIRRVELCALAALDVALFHDLFGDPSAPAPEVQDER